MPASCKRRSAQDLIGVVQRALQAGRDPAETVYNLAKKRGFASGTRQAEDKLQKIADSSRAGARPGGKPAVAATSVQAQSPG
jgi:hypothetical protein